MWKLTKEYWKDMWVLLWSKTTVDDIIIAKANKIKAKAKAIKEAIKKQWVDYQDMFLIKKVYTA